MAIDWGKLTEPFPPDAIEWRIGRSGVKSGRVWATCLAYVTARAIQDRLDEVFGPGGWKNEFRQGPTGGVLCRIYFRNDEGEWVWREDGAGEMEANGGLSESDAAKGSYSSALKRAGSALGIGRFLYRLPEGFANVHDQGRNRADVKDPDNQGKKIYYKWDPPPLPAWALPQPRMTPEEREHAAMLVWLKSRAEAMDETVSVPIGGKPASLKVYMRKNWKEAERDISMAATFCALVKEATGEEFK